MVFLKRTLLICLLILSSLSIAAQDKPQGDLTIVVFGFKEAKGDMIVTYYNDPLAYYEDSDVNFRVDTITLTDVKEGAKSIVMPVSLPEGKYVIHIHHDQNSDGKVSKSLIGIPEEGVGYVNGKALKQPKFTKAAVEVVAGESRVCNITLNYYQSAFK